MAWSLLPLSYVSVSCFTWGEFGSSTIDFDWFNESVPNNTGSLQEYLVNAVVYHVHPLEGPANLRCGHYITYFKHGYRWHLTNDSQVDLVLMAGLRGLPYIVVMERIHALEEDVVVTHDEG